MGVAQYPGFTFIDGPAPFAQVKCLGMPGNGQGNAGQLVRVWTGIPGDGIYPLRGAGRMVYLARQAE